MNEPLCDLFEECKTLNAPLCPIQRNTLENGIWYADEPVCKAKKYQDIPWIKKQKQIAKMGLSDEDGFFTVRMLNTLKVLPKNIKGADPDDPDSESKWIHDHSSKRGGTRLIKKSRTKADKKVFQTPLLHFDDEYDTDDSLKSDDKRKNRTR
jgi:hypothetical protein